MEKKGWSPEIGVKRTMNASGVAVRSVGCKCLPFLLVMKCARLYVPVMRGVPVFSCFVKSAREVPAFRFPREG
ncbi:hypothetical protein TNCV_291 [Trichonephila clavipes]|nr:hypothetical protein TNCV_291 [Trichonephila clavipes]